MDTSDWFWTYYIFSDRDAVELWLYKTESNRDRGRYINEVNMPSDSPVLDVAKPWISVMLAACDINGDALTPSIGFCSYRPEHSYNYFHFKSEVGKQIIEAIEAAHGHKEGV